MFDKKKERKKGFLLLLTAITGWSYGKRKLAPALMGYSREVAVSALFHSGAFDELYQFVLSLKYPYPFSNTDRYALAGMAALLHVGEKEKAFRIAKNLATDASMECIKTMALLIEGHICMEKDSAEMCEKWAERALQELSRKFNFSIFILLFRAFQEVLKAPKDEVISGLLSIVRHTETAYIMNVSDIKDIKRLKQFLALHGLPEGELDRIYVLKNPLMKKESLLAYFEKNPGDSETLKHVLERRVCPELHGLAEKLGIMEGLVREKQGDTPWLPIFCAKPRTHTVKRKAAKRRTKATALFSDEESEGLNLPEESPTGEKAQAIEEESDEDAEVYLEKRPSARRSAQEDSDADEDSSQEDFLNSSSLEDSAFPDESSDSSFEDGERAKKQKMCSSSEGKVEEQESTVQEIGESAGGSLPDRAFESLGDSEDLDGGMDSDFL
ncbi:uncharacterized protein NEMAJ01_0219 [Nematocida major]|uniref:uncharacterized protein n=1 Tax=Nematocida major TaxID=1912982 RepID=UPI0020088A39|nr:uncharacterized protein NEMAJ01_0219 [Nematocida major]KAH9385323.1 hypothetical protein NEMAJ01_0219 [Nematocida major]